MNAGQENLSRGKRLIEDAIPIDVVSRTSASEKVGGRIGHPASLHLWWARRPLAASRAGVYATLVPVGGRHRTAAEESSFFDSLCRWGGPESAIRMAREEVLAANGGQPPKVVDLFAGGGAIPLEAARLGCDVTANELNPVAHLIERMMLEYPQAYPGLADDVRRWGKVWVDRVWAQLFSYFDFTKVWSRRVIAEAVSNAVVANRAGYVVGLVRSDDSIGVREPTLIRLGDMLPSDEIDMSTDAALLEAGHAHQLLDAVRTPVATGVPEGSEETTGVAGRVVTVMDGPTVTPKPPPTKPLGVSRDAITRVELKATVGKGGLFDLSRALSWLRDNADDVEVDISINAAAPEQGFDRVKFRNGVIEPLEEASTDVAVDME